MEFRASVVERQSWDEFICNRGEGQLRGLRFGSHFHTNKVFYSGWVMYIYWYKKKNPQVMEEEGAIPWPPFYLLLAN